MHGGFSSDDNEKSKRDHVDTASIREKVKLARSEKWRILKNICTVSFAFMVQFTAFQVSRKVISMDIWITRWIFREQRISSHRSTQKTRSAQYRSARSTEHLWCRASFFRLWSSESLRSNGLCSSAWCAMRHTLELSSIRGSTRLFRWVWLMESKNRLTNWAFFPGWYSSWLGR